MFNPDTTHRFQFAGPAKKYKKGAYIYREGDEVTGVFTVLKGRVKISKRKVGSQLGLTFYFKEASEFFGILDNFQKTNRRCDAVAVSKEVIVQHIPFFVFEKLLLENPDLQKDLLQSVLEDYESNWAKYREILKPNIDEKIFNSLLRLAINKGRKTEKGIRIEGFTHQELAYFFGVSRQSITGALNRFRKAKTIDYDREYILIKTNME